MKDRLKNVRKARRSCMLVTAVALFDGLYREIRLLNVVIVIIAGGATIAMSTYEMKNLKKQMKQ